MSEDPTTITRGEQTRLAILEAAERLFLSNGYNGTSMREIAHEAGGIAVGGIYNHFSSKEDIFHALLEARSPYAHIIKVLDSLEGDSGPVLIQQAFNLMEDVMEEYFGFIRLVMIDIQEFDGGTIRGLITTVIPHMFRFGQRVKEAGGIRDDVHLFVLLRTFATVMVGYMITQYVIFAQGRPSVPGFPEGILDLDPQFWRKATLDILLHGVADPEHKES